MINSEIIKMADEYANNTIEQEENRAHPIPLTLTEMINQKKANLYLLLKMAFVAGVKATEGVKSHSPHRIQQF